MTKTFRIGIVGPESTGKSWLSQKLADYFHTGYVPEIAREYLENLGRPYEENDLTRIALQQSEAEEKMATLKPEILIADTTLLVIRIWSDFRFGRCDSIITAEEKRRKYDLFLLTDIDLPWEEDPLREHPDRREELFKLYYRALLQKDTPFEIVRGKGKDRLENALMAIRKWKSQGS